jgi:hypothetical protein
MKSNKLMAHEMLLEERNIEVIIVKHSFQMNEKGFLNYLVEEINGREGQYPAYHDDLSLVLPPS